MIRKSWIISLTIVLVLLISQSGGKSARELPLAQPNPVLWKTEYNQYLKEPINVAVWQHYVIVADLGKPAVLKIDTFTGKAVELGEGSPKAAWQYPYGLAVKGDTLYVSDSRKNTIEKFNLLSNTYLGSLFRGSDGTKPGLMAVDQTGSLWLSDLQFKRVVRLNQNGRIAASYGEGVLLHPQGLAFTKQNTVLVADEARGEILEINRQRPKQLTTLFASSGTLNLIRDLASSGDKLYVTLPLNGAVAVLDLHGKLLGNIDTGSIGEFVPMGLTLLPQGGLLVTDRVNARLVSLDM